MDSQPLIKLTFVAPPELLFEDKDVLETVKAELKKRNVEISWESTMVVPNSQGAQVLHELVTTPTWQISVAVLDVFVMLKTVGHVSNEVVEWLKSAWEKNHQKTVEYTIILKPSKAPDSASKVIQN